MFTGNAVDAGREIGAVIEIEAAQEILVGLAVAAVLRDDEARHGLQQLAGAQHRAGFELRARDRALARRLHFADELVALRGDHDFVEIVGGHAGGE